MAAVPEASPLRPDARYARRRRAGRGMRAVVHEAEDLLLGRRVALKQAIDAPASEALLEEARRLACVRSPHVVQIHDLLALEPPAIVLEWLQGSTLRELLEPGQALAGHVVENLVAQLLDALAAAHAAGVVHGDVKPENIWITARGWRRDAAVRGARGSAR
ncbi:MAG: protein kinase [Candidatus Krumholzibacteriia bacterium]